jgi:hypothetical protein
MLALLELNKSHNHLYDCTLRHTKNCIDAIRQARMIVQLDRIMLYPEGHGIQYIVVVARLPT